MTAHMDIIGYFGPMLLVPGNRFFKKHHKLTIMKPYVTTYYTVVGRLTHSIHSKPN